MLELNPFDKKILKTAGACAGLVGLVVGCVWALYMVPAPWGYPVFSMEAILVGCVLYFLGELG